MSVFKYDMAISLLDRDLELAREIANLVSDRALVFLYSEQQRQLVANDGMDEFTSVFRRDSRTVLVLTRKKWGHTQWTRIEETAIKNRGLTDGWDFVTVVPLDGKESVPDWVPQTYIWADLARLGVAGLVAVLERKLKDRGSAIKPESALDLHARLQRETQEREKRTAFLGSKAGADAADAEYTRLESEIEPKAAQLGMHVSRTRSAHRGITLTLNRLSLSFAWVRQYSNTLDGSELQVKLWDGILGQDVGPEFRAKTSKDLMLDFDSLADLHGWRERKGQRRFFSSTELVEYTLKALLNAVAGNKHEL
jgi:hypothetical protein